MKRLKNTILLLLIILGFTFCSNHQVKKLAETPPMGWNSWDSYGLKLNQKTAMANMDTMAKKLKPYGYEYFVIDAGWYSEKEGIHLNEFGLFQPSSIYFPKGFQPVIDHCHQLGLKFGLHLMRGIPREAVKQNLPIKGVKYRAVDIADTSSICTWSSLCYGIDMCKPGAQEYYNSLVKQLADWGVDFIKYDDITAFPKEIEAVEKAIAQCGRPVLLSLSPGEVSDIKYMDVYKKANMLRVTEDIWDTQRSLEKTFEAMRQWNGIHYPNFWIDMDMIPFGQLQLSAPEKLTPSDSAWYAESGMGGPRRWSKLTKDQMLTLITQRAISASPLLIGGDLLSLDDFSLELLTNEDMIECDQNGVMGKLVEDSDSIEIWEAPQRDSKNSWLAIFNRNDQDTVLRLSTEVIKHKEVKSISNIWNPSKLKINEQIPIAAHSAVLIKIER